jgi:hypothetical protein
MDKLINEHFGDNADLQTIHEIEERDSIALERIKSVFF